jgi:hypothetical protein
MQFKLPIWLGSGKGNPNNLTAENPDLANPGIYMIGVKANVTSAGLIVEKPENGSEEKFLPFYSGMVKPGKPGTSLQRRINEHYNTYSNINSSKRDALFNFSHGTSVCRIYAAIELFNRIWIEPGYFVRTRTISERCNLYTAINSIEIPDEYMLLFFQCKTSYYFKMGVPCNNFILRDNFPRHIDAYNTYNSADDPVSSSLRDSYVSTKNFIRDNFYFVYLPMADNSLEDIFLKEAEVKYFLQLTYGIYTQNQLENPASRQLWTDIFMNPSAYYPNPFDFYMPAGNSLDDIIFKRNLDCSKKFDLDKLVEKYKKHKK